MTFHMRGPKDRIKREVYLLLATLRLQRMLMALETILFESPASRKNVQSAREGRGHDNNRKISWFKPGRTRPSSPESSARFQLAILSFTSYHSYSAGPKGRPGAPPRAHVDLSASDPCSFPGYESPAGHGLGLFLVPGQMP